jgi:hypothetical protein
MPCSTESDDHRKTMNEVRFNCLNDGDYSTLAPYFGFKEKSILECYWEAYNIEEPMIYITGLPITIKIDKLKQYLLNKSNQIFGYRPTLIDLYLTGGLTDGKAYLEFKNHDIRQVIINSNNFRLDKSHTLTVSPCRTRPYDVPDPFTQYSLLEGYGCWCRNWTDEESAEMSRKDKEYDEKYGHLSGEIPSDEWVECEVTDEICNEYWDAMNKSMTEHNYQDGEKCGSIPKTILKDKITYELINYSSHGFVCDEPMCQAMFHKYNDEDAGAMGAFIYTRLPIYTCRGAPGLRLREDLCYVCITK